MTKTPPRQRIFKKLIRKKFQLNKTKSNFALAIVPVVPWYGQCVLAARMKSLSLAAQRFHKGTSAIDKIISEVATEHFADILRTISDLTQTYEELHSYRFTDDSDLRVRVNITGERLALYESLENDTRLSKTEHRRLKELYRKIASVAHPDKGGDPEVFTLATYLYTAKDIKGLFLLWISEVEPDASHDWEKRIALLGLLSGIYSPRRKKKVGWISAGVIRRSFSWRSCSSPS